MRSRKPADPGIAEIGHPRPLCMPAGMPADEMGGIGRRRGVDDFDRRLAGDFPDLVAGKTLDEIRELTREDVLDELGIDLGPVRLKCALLPLKVVKAGAYGLDGSAETTEDEEDW